MMGYYWNCWTLYKKDIERAAASLNVDPELLTDQTCERIAECFREGLGWANEDWRLLLGDAIRLVVG